MSCSHESHGIFLFSSTMRLKLCKHVTRVLFMSQYAVHEYHSREAETLWFLALIDACSSRETERATSIFMSMGDFLLLRNTSLLPHLKLGNISLITSFK